MNWLFTSTDELTVGSQLLIEALKWLMAFATAMIITRWTLARADRKDVLNRQAAALDRYSVKRIESLDEANAALGRIRLHLTLLKAAARPPKGFAEKELIEEELIDKVFEMENSARDKIDKEINNLLLSCEAYGWVPGSIPCDWLDVGEAIIVWTAPFYQATTRGEVNPDGYQEAYEMCSDLQMQIRWLKMYEMDMQLEGNKNPRKVWSSSSMQMLEEKPLAFLFNPNNLDENQKEPTTQESP